MEQNQINLSTLDRMLEDLTEKGWSTANDIFADTLLQALARECQTQHALGKFHQASIGRGVSKSTHREVRGDHTRWLEEHSHIVSEQIFLKHLRDILQALNETFYLNLKRYEAHFALYPPGTGYDKHVDNHRGTGHRKITFILYLNESWQKEHGGELSLFHPQDENQKLAVVEPRWGTFVLFRSDLFPHQVEKSFHPRQSLTGWFRDDAS